jgi:hypothetical protein
LSLSYKFELSKQRTLKISARELKYSRILENEDGDRFDVDCAAESAVTTTQLLGRLASALLP